MFSYSRLLQWFPKYFIYIHPAIFFYSTVITRGIFFRGQSYHIFRKVLLIHLGSMAILWRIVTTIFIVAFKFCMFCPSLLLPFSFYWVFFFFLPAIDLGISLFTWHPVTLTDPRQRTLVTAELKSITVGLSILEKGSLDG